MSEVEKPVIVAQWEAEHNGVKSLEQATSLMRGMRMKQVRFGKGDEKRSSARAVTDRARSLAWNYNTVESILLFCACMVIMAGLMFQSEGMKPGGEDESIVLSGTILIISFSFIYFITVVATEFWTAMEFDLSAVSQKFQRHAPMSVVKFYYRCSGTKWSSTRTNSTEKDAEKELKLKETATIVDKQVEAGIVFTENPNPLHQRGASAGMKDGVVIRDMQEAEEMIASLQTQLKDAKKKIQTQQLKSANGHASATGSAREHRRGGSTRQNVSGDMTGEDSQSGVGAETEQKADTKSSVAISEGAGTTSMKGTRSGRRGKGGSAGHKKAFGQQELQHHRDPGDGPDSVI